MQCICGLACAQPLLEPHTRQKLKEICLYCFYPLQVLYDMALTVFSCFKCFVLHLCGVGGMGVCMYVQRLHPPFPLIQEKRSKLLLAFNLFRFSFVPFYAHKALLHSYRVLIVRFLSFNRVRSLPEFSLFLSLPPPPPLSLGLARMRPAVVRPTTAFRLSPFILDTFVSV